MKKKEDFSFSLPYSDDIGHRHWLIIIGLVLLLGGFFTLGVMRVAYRGKILPGAQAYGIYLGGLTKEEGVQLIDSMSKKYREGQTVTISTPDKKIAIKASDLSLTHTSSSVIDELYATGRQGWINQQLWDEFLLLVGATSPRSARVQFDGAKVAQALSTEMDTVNTVVADPKLSVSNESVTITESQPGTRVSLYKTLGEIQAAAGRFEQAHVRLQTYTLESGVQTSDLAAKQSRIAYFVKNPLKLTYDTRSWDISAQDIASWIGSSSPPPLSTDILHRAYLDPSYTRTRTGFSKSRIEETLNQIAGQINQTAVDAKLTISGERATVFQQSRDGLALDAAATAERILEQLSLDSRSLALSDTVTTPLVVSVTKADISDETIDRLGIKELLSEGVSYFPGSPANRLQNIRQGTARYEGVLLKPGQIFSFGELLGEVGPETGYAPGLIILGDHEEKAYGGGLCQVSSTAFRAALLAGLPILERTNHAFAVSYYTAPFGVPGVDATIYYPQVDFKFKNDTDNYILIQTELRGTTLKFRFYGTKKKSGIIRGPFFISGSNDANAPSRTVFYRDVIVDGQVTKTDTFYTNYKSALDFPIVD